MNCSSRAAISSPRAARHLRALRREMQMVFQDPFASLDPRMRVGAIVGEPLEIHEPRLARAERRERVAEVLRAVGMGEDALARYPHEFSGGQRQRIGIARALVLRPRLVVADEPVSALDVSVGAQILELLQNLQRDFALTYLLISHSLPVVAQLATRIAVMQGGRIVETGAAAQILSAPAHPYTQSLIAAIPALPAAGIARSCLSRGALLPRRRYRRNRTPPRATRHYPPAKLDQRWNFILKF